MTAGPFPEATAPGRPEGSSKTPLAQPQTPATTLSCRTRHAPRLDEGAGHPTAYGPGLLRTGAARSHKRLLSLRRLCYLHHAHGVMTHASASASNGASLALQLACAAACLRDPGDYSGSWHMVSIRETGVQSPAQRTDRSAF